MSNLTLIPEEVDTIIRKYPIPADHVLLGVGTTFWTESIEGGPIEPEPELSHTLIQSRSNYKEFSCMILNKSYVEKGWYPYRYAIGRAPHCIYAVPKDHPLAALNEAQNPSPKLGEPIHKDILFL